jgi:hypothetical protein
MPYSAEELAIELEKRSGRQIDLKINRNVSNLLTVNPVPLKGGGGDVDYLFKVSLNFIFLDSPLEVVKALASFLKRATKRNRAVIRRFINENYHKIEAPAAPVKTVIEGHFFNLQLIIDKLKRVYFDSGLDIKITWARSPKNMPGAWNEEPGNRKRTRKGSTRCIQFATFDEKRNLIRVNPRLDNPSVPLYFIEFVIYHEMLHAVVKPTITPSGRMTYHHSEFRRRERLFPYYEAANEWEKDCLSKI